MSKSHALSSPEPPSLGQSLVVEVNGKRRKTHRPVHTILEDDSLVDRLKQQSCSSCRPHPSYYDADENIPVDWHHTPWDEVEMRKHELLDSQCRRVKAIRFPKGKEEQGVKTSDSSRRTIDSAKGTESAVERKLNPDEEYASEESEDEDEDDSREWTITEEGPIFQYYVDESEVVERGISVKQLPDGGRLIIARGDRGCWVRIVENTQGERVLVTTRCYGREEGDQKSSATSTPSDGTKEPKKGAGSSVQASLSTPTVTEGSEARPFALMSNLRGADKTEPPTISPPPTVPSSVAEPAALDSVVEDEKSPASPGRKSTTNRVSAEPKTDRMTVSRTMKPYKGSGRGPVKVHVNVSVKLGPKQGENADEV